MFLLGLLGIALILVVLWDVFETVVLPRRVTRGFWLASVFFRGSWSIWSYVPRRMAPTTLRETFLGFYAPLTLLFLLMWWAGGLITGFGLIHYGFETELEGEAATLAEALYYSGTSFFTLGLGDLATTDGFGRFLTVVESGVGFGFLALAISYLPVLYQAFSRREVAVSLLDARAGSPPSAGELLRRHGAAEDPNVLQSLLADWEHWAAEVLESHLSYPILCYFRSQHQRQSWLTGLTAILDASSLLMVSGHPAATKEAELAYRVGRHALIDLSQTLKMTPRPFVEDRLPPEELERLLPTLEEHAVLVNPQPELHAKLGKLRASYEPYVNSLADLLLMQVPPWMPAEGQLDDWQVSPWDC